MCVDHLKIFSGMLDEPIIHPSIVETHPKLNKKKQSTFMYYKNTKTSFCRTAFTTTEKNCGK